MTWRHIFSMSVVGLVGLVGLVAVSRGLVSSAAQDQTTAAHNADWTPVEQDFDGVAMVQVPAGCFMMGSDRDDLISEPAHEQCFDAPYWIDKYEVTNEQFAHFKGKAANENFWIGDTAPREFITWFEAHDFCMLRDAALPTEREWEYAARGPDNLVYPWGNDWNKDNVIWERNANGHTAKVGNRPESASWVGAEDLSGNVMEWVGSHYKRYPYDPADGREDGLVIVPDEFRNVRGGTWYSADPDEFRTSLRMIMRSNEFYFHTGFRCARPVTPAASSTLPTDTAFSDEAARLPVAHNADWTCGGLRCRRNANGSMRRVGRTILSTPGAMTGMTTTLSGP